ncbi:hypothetical protein IWX90DRAFT_277000 [Phyllosticta citrichinensis]|uniref:Uncharacterized protein n=1 Tax=Phyllosticta citrichinensis TaxID=1130410 RepID=A0ABR1XNC5_9PEZI
MDVPISGMPVCQYEQAGAAKSAAVRLRTADHWTWRHSWWLASCLIFRLTAVDKNVVRPQASRVLLASPRLPSFGPTQPIGNICLRASRRGSGRSVAKKRVNRGSAGCGGNGSRRSTPIAALVDWVGTRRKCRPERAVFLHGCWRGTGREVPLRRKWILEASRLNGVQKVIDRFVAVDLLRDSCAVVMLLLCGVLSPTSTLL